MASWLGQVLGGNSLVPLCDLSGYFLPNSDSD